MLTFDQLETVRVIAAAGSFNRAANELFLTQSALSQRVKQLERMLGVELFDRQRPGHKPALTLAGERVLRFANEAHDLYTQLQRDVRAFADPQHEHDLVIAAPVTATQYILPHLLSHFYSLYPKIHVQLVQSVGDEVNQRLRAGEVELGIRAGASFPPWVRATPFLADAVLLVARPGHSLLSHRRIDVRELPRYPLAAPPSGTFLRDLLSRWSDAAGLTLDIAMEAVGPDALKEAAIHGPGLAIVFRSTALHEIQDGTLGVVAVQHTPIDAQHCFLSMAGHELSPAAAALVTVACQSDWHPFALAGKGSAPPPHP